jgi:hypothetical protein
VSPGLTAVALGGDLDEALGDVPSAPGVGQILGPDDKSLILGRPANLRRWAASHLGAGKPRKKGARPPVDLTPVATAVAFVRTTSAFHQRLAFERLMARYVAPSARRDLKPAFYLHLDPGERFPRITARSGFGDANLSTLFGPFRDRGAADRARQGIEKLHRLRPCDYVFEPEVALPLGLGCVYAQVATCAAPCLLRVSEEAYRSLARQAADFLNPGNPRPPEIAALLKPWVAPIGSFGLVSEQGSSGLELSPVAQGAVFEEGAAVQADGEPRAQALSRLAWPGEAPPRDDSAWLSSWLHASRRAGEYRVFQGRPSVADLAERLRAPGL